jgi:hypothetical protein
MSICFGVLVIESKLLTLNCHLGRILIFKVNLMIKLELSYLDINHLIRSQLYFMSALSYLNLIHGWHVKVCNNMCCFLSNNIRIGGLVQL